MKSVSHSLLNLPCPGLPALICLQQVTDTDEACWGRGWNGYMTGMKCSQLLSSKCSTDAGIGNHAERKKKMCVFLTAKMHVLAI